jgi:hypothetical protein
MAFKDGVLRADGDAAATLRLLCSGVYGATREVVGLRGYQVRLTLGQLRSHSYVHPAPLFNTARPKGGGIFLSSGRTDRPAVLQLAAVH